MDKDLTGRSGGGLRTGTGPGNPSAHGAEQGLRLIAIIQLILETDLVGASLIKLLLKHLGLDLATAGLHLKAKLIDPLTQIIEALDQVDLSGIVLILKECSLVSNSADSTEIVIGSLKLDVAEHLLDALVVYSLVDVLLGSGRRTVARTTVAEQTAVTAGKEQECEEPQKIGRIHFHAYKDSFQVCTGCEYDYLKPAGL